MAQDDEREIETDDSGASAADIPLAENNPPTMTSSMKMPSPPINPVLQQYLQNKQQMADAQKKASDNEMYTGLARAAASLSAGLAKSTAPVDQRPFDAMAATDQQPVTDVMNAQKSQATDLANQQAALDTQKKFNSTDPNSPESLAVKAQIKRLYPGKYDPATLDPLSASEIGDSIMKPLELNQKIMEHKDEMKSRAADRDALFLNKKEDKADADHDKYVQHVEDAEKSWRSDPASTRFDAMLSATASGKALIDRYRGHEDDMPIQDIHALVSDRLKAITGNAPTEQEIKAQMPSTLMATVTHPISYVTGDTMPAGAGGFVKNIDQSFQEMEKTARAGLQHRQETVASSPRLTQEDRDRLVKIGVPEPAYNNPGQPAGGAQQDHASRAAEILAKRQAARSQPSPLIPPAQGDQPGYAFGGAVQPPGFQHIRQPVTSHIPTPRPMAMPMPKAPVAQIPIGMRPSERPMHFESGGTVPGQPNMPFNSPANDTVNAKLTPKEEVLPLSVTQSKSPALAAYMHMKSRGYK